MKESISVSEADDLLEEALFRTAAMTVPIQEALGRVLGGSVAADRDIPPYHRVTMDGVAVSSAAVVGGRRQFRVAGTALAGQPATGLPGPDSCIRIMTGAVLPTGADCVIPVEELSVVNGVVTLAGEVSASPGRSVHRQGSDVPEGREVLGPGTMLDERHLGVLASVGRSVVRVAELPRVAVITTGDEVVPVAGPVESHQVRQSNLHATVSLLRRLGITPVEALHLPDQPELLERTIGEVSERCNVLLTCGAVSRGDTDILPRLLHGAGYTPRFHRVLQRPGKPLWFGAREGQPGLAFGLPGNPVSVLVCLRRYVAPALLKLQGAAPAPPWQARLAKEVNFKPRLTWFLPVSLEWRDGGLAATPRPVGTSGDYVGVVASSGLMELAAEQEGFPAGHLALVHPWSNPA